MISEYNYHTRVMGCDFDMTFIAHSTNEADDYFTKAVEIATIVSFIILITQNIIPYFVILVYNATR